ncbi:unnamed protein product [Urochloa humidicola]
MRGIWGKFRAAFCISGGNRRPLPTCSPAGLIGGGDEGGGDEALQEDLLSALPNDLLLLVLLRLPSAAAAARTSVLSRRWRRLWAELPWLLFPEPTDLARPRAALAALAAPALNLLHIVASDADPDDAAAVLLLAAPRLTGMLVFHDAVPQRAWTWGSVDLPCFEKAVRIHLCLGYHGLAFPLTGVFAKLTVLHLYCVRFHGSCDLGDGLSSARCPSLRVLCVCKALGVSNFAIRSVSLISMHLSLVKELQQLTIVAPMLRQLGVCGCFVDGGRQPVAQISAPVLDMLWWDNAYHMSSVQLGKLSHLRELRTCCTVSYGYHGYPYNLDPMMLLQRFQKIPILHLLIIYPANQMDSQYLAEIITSRPDIEELSLGLGLSVRGHAFGPCVFHLLGIFSGIRKLKMKIYKETKNEPSCSLGCVCHQPQNWENEELYLNSLQEVEICQLRGSEHELTFLKRLLKWTAALKTITLVFDPSVTVSDQICQELLIHFRPETCVKIYLRRNGSKVMYEQNQ